MKSSALTPITATIPGMAALAGVGISKIQELVRKGRVQTITLGARRLVVVDSYRQLVETELAGPPKDARRNGAVPALGSKGKRGRARALGTMRSVAVPLNPPVPLTAPLDVRVAELGLSTRAMNALRNDGIDRVASLVELSKRDLLYIPNFGRRCLGEVEAALALLHLQLAPQTKGRGRREAAAE